MSDHCKSSEIKARKKELESLTAETSLRYKNSFIGKDVSILVEKTRDKKTGKLCGYSDRYMKVLFDGTDDLMNEIVDVHVEEILPQFVMGKCYSHAERGNE
jgi:threonylcarbamoyladenosine tRNA methylthiotransferase MtaB